jgi:hypothetical protein
MMSYRVIDRDRARVVEELDLARQIEPSPVYRRKADSRHWFRSSLVEREAIHTHLASF